ncbi:MAG: ATP-binding protein [Undibacterium sp.]|nr:ATP-binding protein [Undibacterium sp.]
MEILVTNDEVARDENALASLQGVERITLLVKLAWQLRQRDTRRALNLADEAEILLTLQSSLVANATLTPHDIHLLNARLRLVRGEARWLFSELDQAQQLAESALSEFTRLGGTDGEQGCADAHYLLACVSMYRGGDAIVESELAQATLISANSHDSNRETLAQCFLAVQTALHNLPKALTQWGGRFRADVSTGNPVIAACHFDFLAYTSALSSDFGHAATYGMQTYELALQSGQIRRAINAAVNVGDAFNSLNDHQAALQWMQVGHDLARQTGWPISIGSCLIYMAETLRRLGRLDAAKELLEDAIPLLFSVVGARLHMVALRYLGDLSLDRGEYNAALNCFRELQEQADKKNQFDFRIGSRRGEAHALSLLGKPQEALAVAQEAFSLATESADHYRKIDVLRVLAAIHLRHQLPAPTLQAKAKNAASAPLHYLTQAVETAASISGYALPGELLEEMADAQAAINNYQEAFRLSRLAITAREKIHNQAATNRATAMQVSHQTERMRAESEHLRQLADGEAERAEVLQQTGAVLERLGAIGQEITASLDADAVFQTLNRHVHGLLHVTAFVIYIMDADQQSITSSFGVENGLPIDTDTIQMSSTGSRSVQCIKERREILIEFSPNEEILGLIPGTERVLSMLFAPLTIGDKILGAMTIQSSKHHAYGERERMIFRSLCAFGAIALGNADAYLRLKETQAHLVAQEKLAALGSLVAGVAHELNTPIGNCLLVASTVQDSSKDIIKKLADQSLRKSELNSYCDDVKNSSEIMMRSLTSAASLISSFKQVAVDRTSEQRRLFDVRQVLQDIIATLHIRIGHAGHAVTLEVPMNIQMDSYPGSLGQVVTNLIENAILHAFDKGQTGMMTLKATLPEPGRVLLQFSDNGAGIPEENLSRVFDPFFTTKLGQGGSGLGLNICYNIVTSVMHGQLTVKSTVGAGTTFSLDCPLSV